MSDKILNKINTIIVNNMKLHKPNTNGGGCHFQQSGPGWSARDRPECLGILRVVRQGRIVPVRAALVSGCHGRLYVNTCTKSDLLYAMYMCYGFIL